jgi:ribonucleoside-diphosphate reductase beta chain
MQLPQFGKTVDVDDKRILNGPPSQKLHPVKYDWIWQKYLDDQANHWLPLDIPMGNDRYQYNHELRDSERHMFDMCLAMLTTQDLVIMANIEEGLEQHITLPEAKMYMARQADMESIHTWSYQHIIESLALDPDSIYDKYLHEPTLYAKVEYMHNWHSQMAHLIDTKTEAGRREFLVNYAFWSACFEGGMFYEGFNMIGALRRRNILEGTTTQLKYIRRDEAMHMNFGIDLINQIRLEEPSLWNAGLDHQVLKTMHEVTDLEEAYARAAIDNVLGYSYGEYINQFKYRMNVNATKLGLSQIPFPDNTRPVSMWIDTVFAMSEENFFETRVTNYQKGLKW